MKENTRGKTPRECEEFTIAGKIIVKALVVKKER
jgi:hypothetical protein